MHIKRLISKMTLKPISTSISSFISKRIFRIENFNYVGICLQMFNWLKILFSIDLIGRFTEHATLFVTSYLQKLLSWISWFISRYYGLILEINSFLKFLPFAYTRSPVSKVVCPAIKFVLSGLDRVQSEHDVFTRVHTHNGFIGNTRYYYPQLSGLTISLIIN